MISEVTPVDSTFKYRVAKSMGITQDNALLQEVTAQTVLPHYRTFHSDQIRGKGRGAVVDGEPLSIHPAEQMKGMLYASKFVLLLSCLVTGLAHADGAAEMARKLQNPLANIKAMMTDNAIGFDTGKDGGTSYGFQLQPVYAVDMPEKGFTLLPRGVIPVLGLEPGTDLPVIGDPSSNTSSQWGLGDSILQLFFAPHVESEWKWGVGPMFSIPTHTDDAFKGADWGAGVAGVLAGNITPDLSFAGIIGNMWGDSGNFNTLSLQPMLYYNIPSKPGVAIAYNAMISADWEASSSNRWTVPLGLTYSQTLDMGDGNGLDLSVGPYYNVVRPEGAARWQIRFGASWLFP